MEKTEYQREQLIQSGQDMLHLCVNQFEKAAEAFMEWDADLAEEVLHKESRVNAMDLKIEKECERFIALYNPVASDLRLVLAVLKINIELERIADHAFGISKHIVEETPKIDETMLELVSFRKMVETVSRMFECIVSAYEENNLKDARKVFKKDKILDKINENSFETLETVIKKDNSLTKQALVLLSVIKKFERAGDLVKNIAEEIIFYQEAEILKHRKKKK